MPIKLQVCLQSPRQLSTAPDVRIQVEMEVADSLAGEPGQLQEAIFQLVRLAQAALVAEPGGIGAALARTGPELRKPPPPAPAEQEAPHGYRAYPGAPPSEATGVSAPSEGAALVRLATVPQIRAIVRLAQERRLHLGPLLQARFHVRRLEDLTRHQASALIGLLKSGRDPFIAAFFAEEEEPQGGPQEPGPGG